MIYVRLILCWFVLLGAIESLGQENDGYLSKLTKEEAVEIAENIIRQANAYSIDDQQLVYDSLELLVNYFRIDSLRYTTYFKRGRFEFFANNDVKKALQYFTNAKELALKNNNAEQELNALVQIAQLYSNTSIDEKATETLNELVWRAEEVGDSSHISAAYFQLGLASVNVSDYTIQMLKKSLAYSNPGMRNLVKIYANLGQAYLLIDPPNPDSAQYYLEIGNRINDTARVSLAVPLNLVETYLMQGYYARADSLINQVLSEPSYGNYDFSLLTYDLKVRLLQHQEQHQPAYEYILKGIENIVGPTVFDDYEIVDFSRTAKKSLYALNDLDNYRKLDSIERAANDSIMVYIETSQINRTENAYTINELEEQIAQQDDEIQYKNIALIIGGVTLLFVLISVYQTVGKNTLKSKLRTENQRMGQIEQQREASDRYATKLEREMATKIQQQERQLLSYMASLSYKNTTLKDISALLDEIRNERKGNRKIEIASTMLTEILESEDPLKNFFKHFENVHPEFYKKLDKHSMSLTKQDKRVLAYIKMRLTSKEIAQLLGVNYESVNTSRYRLRKKLNLAKQEELDAFLESL